MGLGPIYNHQARHAEAQCSSYEDELSLERDAEKHLQQLHILYRTEIAAKCFTF